MWKKFKRNLQFWRKSSFLAQDFLCGEEFFSLREATLHDIKEILQVQRDVYEGETPWTKSVFQMEFKNTAPHLYLVITHHKRVVAYIGARVDGKEAHITNLAVHSAYQGSRFSKKLIAEIERFARKHSVDKMILEVRFYNKMAQRVYRAYGFKSEKILNGYYEKNKEDAICMTYDLREKTKK